MFKQVIASLAAAVVLAVPVPAHADPPSTLDGLGAVVGDYMTEALRADDVPGAAVSVVSGGRTVYSQGFGFADLSSRTPVDPERTGFLIGSQAKLFTARAALQLVASGKLDLDADVNTYLRGFQIPDTYPGRPVTLRHLLTHTAGFDEDHLLGSGGTDPATIPDFGERVEATVPERVRPPGETVTYSNFGFGLAGYLVETASGMPYDRYVAEHVLAPLGMSGTSVAVPAPEGVAASLATGYASVLGSNEPVDVAYADFPASGAGPISTSADMARYMTATLADPGEMLRQQRTEDPSLPGMGFGWEQMLVNGHRTWFKGGDFPGFHSTMFLLPEYGIGVHLIANGDGYGGNGIDGFSLIRRIVDAYLPALTAPTAVGIPADSREYEGWYHSSRTSANSLYKLKSLFEKPIHVRATDDGGIITDGIWDDGITWVQVAPGQFARPGTWDRLVFKANGTVAVSGATEVLERTALLAHPYFHLTLLGLAVLIALIALVWLPAAAIKRRRLRASHATAWAASVLILGTVATLIGLSAAPSNFQIAIATASPAMIAMLAMATLTVPAALALTAFSANAWIRHRWTLRGRLGHTAVTAATIAFATIAMIYNMTGPSYT